MKCRFCVIDCTDQFFFSVFANYRVFPFIIVCGTYALEAATFINEMVIYSTIDETRIYHTGFTIICSLWFMRIMIIEM